MGESSPDGNLTHQVPVLLVADLELTHLLFVFLTAELKLTHPVNAQGLRQCPVGQQLGQPA